ncbi:MAG: hypothetical protein LBG82_05995 [Clostridiales Family XIII bacterium]|jgi:beta-N-acetylhexosaminidase|nr:hypothetical protein [Clostridiales Family XIII bacterium]
MKYGNGLARRRCGLLAVLLCAALLVPLCAGGTVYAASDEEKDVSGWSDRQLAAQLLMLATGTHTKGLVGTFTKKGIGGICLQTPIPADLGKRIARAAKDAPLHIRPFIASDEEGGKVQRFRERIYPLPSARVMGGYADRKITSMTRKYAKRLAKYRVNVVFGPVADLKVKGRYIASLDRAFASSPRKVWEKSDAWSKGFESEGIIVTYKHWPGKGSAADTHKKSSSVPKLSKLEKRDMIPFDKKFAQGCEMVMVGHVRVPGLTEKAWPTTLSKNAYRYLREKAGADTVIVTDSLSMAASSTAVGLSTKKAAVRALASGADIALVVSDDSADSMIGYVAKAIKSGKIPRQQAEESAKRILRLKEKHGLA